MQSVEHPEASLKEPPFYNWRAPIRAQVLQKLCLLPLSRARRSMPQQIAEHTRLWNVARNESCELFM